MKSLDGRGGRVDPKKVGELVTAAAEGDKAAWRQLVEHFSGLVWSVARGVGLDVAESSDVLQTTWLRLAEHLGRMKNPERVAPWLATTARREAQRVARASQRVVLTSDQTLLEPHEVDEDSPERFAIEAEQADEDAKRDRMLWEAFRELSGRCQELLRLLVMQPTRSYVEIAAALDIRIGSIGPTRARCLQRLRENLAKRGITGDSARS
jgi:RNA polymerase sigma factor (sigma-70 family)